MHLCSHRSATNSHQGLQHARIDVEEEEEEEEEEIASPPPSIISDDSIINQADFIQFKD
jgi:hypothetical protein